MKKILFGVLICFSFAQNAFAGDYYIVGVDCFKKGLYEQSSRSLEHAVRVSPKNVDARYYLAQCYLSQNRLQEAQEQYNRIIILAPHSNAAILSQKGLSLIRQSYLEAGQKTKSTGDFSQFGDNYLSYVIGADGNPKKWASFPITVYIQPKKPKNLAMNACMKWQESTKGLVKFKFVNDPKAQITIDFRDKLESTSTKEGYIAGYSKPYYQGDYIVKSDIHILAVDPDTAKPLEDSFIEYSTLHELGHSLGFKGHSPNNNDVMYGQANDAKSSLTQRDVNTMSLLYKLDKKTLLAKTQGSSDVQLKEAQDYVKKAPEKSVGWANLGDVYRGKKMYKEAIKSYQKAVSLEPNKAELHNLLGTAYVASGDYKSAFSSLKTACDLDKSNIYYLYQFGQVCANTGQKEVGKTYLNSYLKANPSSANDEKIQNLLKIL